MIAPFIPCSGDMLIADLAKEHRNYRDGIARRLTIGSIDFYIFRTVKNYFLEPVI